MVFWGRQFPPKNERKQVNQRYHSRKVEFVRSFFGGNRWPQKTISKLTDLYVLSYIWTVISSLFLKDENASWDLATISNCQKWINCWNHQIYDRRVQKGWGFHSIISLGLKGEVVVGISANQCTTVIQPRNHKKP